MPEYYSQFGEAAGAAMAHNARMAAQTAEAQQSREQLTAAPPAQSARPPADEQHAAIRAREAAATPGPWTWTEDGIQAANDEWVMWPANTGTGAAETAAGQLGACGRHTETHAEENLAFLAHARQDVPALLAEADRLRAERDQARADASASRLASPRTPTCLTTP